MKPNVTALERAFELAVSGECASVEDIKVALKREGYDVLQVQGRALGRQLREAIARTRSG